VLQIAAFLLPLKVMILLGSQRIPSYFPQALANIERESLILILASAAVVLYLAHLAMDYVGAILAGQGSRKLILEPLAGEAGGKQQKIALNLYRRFIVVVSGGAFGFAVLLFFFFFRPVALGVVLAYLVGVILLVEFLFLCAPALHQHALIQFSRLIDVISACGFLLVFGSLVMSFLYGSSEGLLLGILVLLLCRQMFSRLAMALKSIERLYREREKALPALLGSRGRLDDYEEDNEDDDLPGLLDGGSSAVIRANHKARPHRPYWDMVAPPRCRQLLNEILAADGAVVAEVEQLDAGLRGQLLLHVVGQGGPQSSVHYLFRLFHNNHAPAANRAAELLMVYQARHAPVLLATDEREGFPAHLYNWDADALLVVDSCSINECREQLFAELGAWPVPKELQCTEGQLTLVRRCNRDMWLRCQAFSRWMDHETRGLVDAFVEAPDRLSLALSDLPLRIYNPDVEAGHVYKSALGYKVAWWGGWRVEPIGCGWPLALGFERFTQVFAGIREQCVDLKALSASQVYLAALAFEFEARCEVGAYVAAFERLKEIRDVLEQLEF
jgi:hypothetical protein